MKKRIMSLISLAILLLVWACIAVGCWPVVKLPELNERPKFTEYLDEDGKIYFRTVGGYAGFGYLMLNGKKVPAKYYIDPYESYYDEGRVNITVSIPKEEDLRTDTEPTDRTYTSDFLVVKDKEKDGNNLLYAKNVVVFGESIGTVSLVAKQLEKSDFEPWEYGIRWESKISEEWKILDFVGVEEVYNAHKCVTIYARKTEQDKTQACILKWLPEQKGFEIYLLEDQSQIEPSAGQQPIATGTYVFVEEVVTLTFVTDKLFDGAYPTLDLTLR